MHAVMGYNVIAHIPTHLGLEVVDVAPKYSDAFVDDVIRRYQAGHTQAEIAVEVGVQAATVSRWIKQRGATISRSEVARRYNARLSPEERSARAAAAHDAVRGMKRTPEDLTKRAASREANPSNISIAERMLSDWLAVRGVETIPQKAIGPYNTDLGAYPVAVEVFGGNWHANGRHIARHSDRVRYILDAGWHVIIVWSHGLHSPLSVEAADYVVSFLQSADRNPSATRQYRVVRGSGEIIAFGCAKDDDFSFVPTYRTRDEIRCGHELPWE